jgi:hypothetical protein
MPAQKKAGMALRVREIIPIFLHHAPAFVNLPPSAIPEWIHVVQPGVVPRKEPPRGKRDKNINFEKIESSNLI